MPIRSIGANDIVQRVRYWLVFSVWCLVVISDNAPFMS